MSDFVVHISDARALGFCVRGVKQFCDDNGLNFREFCRHGLPADAFEQTGDARALRLVETVREKQASTTGDNDEAS